MALRVSFFLLIFANLVFFAWGQGYFGGGDPNREAERLAQQLQPDKLRLISVPGAAPAVAPAPTSGGGGEIACRIVGGLRMVDAESLKTAATAASFEAQLMPQLDPALYLVVITDLPNLAAAEKKAAELKRIGVEQQETVALDGGRQEIVLGRFPAEPAAREFLVGLNRRGIKSARIDARDQPPAKARVELRGPATKLVQQLPQLIAPHADAAVMDCPR
ncbi:MAG: hypothetical protein HZB40_12100 [Rhodocyclales bacterium]|nr:hypothetical protein [Rhodocyclales bacterium]